MAAEAVGVATAPVDPVVGVVIAAVGVVLATPAVSIALVGALASAGLADSPSPEHAVARKRIVKIVDIRLTIALLIKGPAHRPFYGRDFLVRELMHPVPVWIVLWIYYVPRCPRDRSRWQPY